MNRGLRGVALLGVAVLHTACSALAPVPAWERPPPPAAERPLLRDGALTRAQLPNGLDILVHEDHSLPLVGVSITLRRGAASEAPDEVGLAAYTAELLERGAGSRDALAFAEATDALGARFGAGAGWDSVAVSISGLSRDLDLLLDLLADAALRPHFDPREAERARDEMLAALERSKDDPSSLAVRQASRAIYGEHRYGRPSGGDAESVATFDAQVARDFHARLFVPNAALISVTGDVEPEAIIAALRRRFGDWKRGPILEPGAPPPARSPETRSIRVVDRPDLNQARIVVGHEGMARADETRIAASLLNTVLGGSGFSSRLMLSLRSDEGLTYGVGSGFSLRRTPGPFSVSTFTKVESARAALDLLLAELERARSEPPGEDELVWARTLMTGRFALGLETAQNVTSSLVDLDVHGLPEDSLDTYRARVRAITAEDVAEAARARMHPERAAIVLVGPAEQLVPQLEGLGAVVEVVTP